MEKKIFSTMDGTDYPTDIPLDLVETIEKKPTYGFIFQFEI